MGWKAFVLLFGGQPDIIAEAYGFFGGVGQISAGTPKQSLNEFLVAHVMVTILWKVTFKEYLD